MGITLRKSDGDLFIDPETGRPDEITGATKTDQDLTDLYLSNYDTTRAWGSSLSLSQMGGVISLEQARALLFLRLHQANERIMAKQAQDTTLTAEEKIQQFSTTDVMIDAINQAVIFFSVADVGDETVAKVIGQDFKATSTKHVLPSPVGLTSSN